MEVNPIDVALFMLSILLSVWLLVDVDVTTVADLKAFIVPVVLTIGGGAGIAYAMKIKREESVNPEMVKQPLYYFLLATLALLIAGSAASHLPANILDVSRLSVTDANVYGSLMAIAETIFFIGLLTAYLYDRWHNAALAMAGAASIFTAYHFLVYGDSPVSMGFVFFAGLMLSWTYIKTGSQLAAALAHIVNNLVAYGFFSALFGGTLVGQVIAPAAAFMVPLMLRFIVIRAFPELTSLWEGRHQ